MLQSIGWAIIVIQDAKRRTTPFFTCLIVPDLRVDCGVRDDNRLAMERSGIASPG